MYGGTSFGMRPFHLPRRAVIWLVELPIFEPLVLIIITCNCVTMAITSPLDPGGTQKAQLLEAAELAFLGCFTAELVLKVVAYGMLFSRDAYLRDAWCQLDFIVVAFAWLPIINPAAEGWQAVRALRALRPLRVLRRIPGMPKLIYSVRESIPKLTNVLTLFGFLFVMSGAAAVQIFRGAFRYRCAKAPSEEVEQLPWWDVVDRLHKEAPQALPSTAVISAAAFGNARETGEYCSPLADATCARDSACVYFPTDPVPATSFDSIGLACLSILQCITFDVECPRHSHP